MNTIIYHNLVIIYGKTVCTYVCHFKCLSVYWPIYIQYPTQLGDEAEQEKKIAEQKRQSTLVVSKGAEAQRLMR